MVRYKIYVELYFIKSVTWYTFFKSSVFAVILIRTVDFYNFYIIAIREKIIGYLKNTNKKINK